jgi:hypothetical protein
MPMGWEIRDGQRVRVVEEKILLAWWRQRLQNWPTHQYRLRALQASEAAAQDATRRIPATDLTTEYFPPLHSKSDRCD